MNKIKIGGFSLIEVIVLMAIISSISFVGIYSIKALKNHFEKLLLLSKIQTVFSHQSKTALITGKTGTAFFDIANQSFITSDSQKIDFKQTLKNVNFGALETDNKISVFFYPSGSNSAGRIYLNDCEIIISRLGAIRDTC